MFYTLDFKISHMAAEVDLVYPGVGWFKENQHPQCGCALHIHRFILNYNFFYHVLCFDLHIDL